MEELQGDFALNKPGWFTVQAAAENEFLNGKLDNDTYGIWYSVQFIGNAETFLWQTKTTPVEGEKYWGWLEKTKSGKAVKFKWDKQNAPNPGSSPQNGSTGSSVPHNDDKEDSIARAVALKAATELLAAHGDANSDVLGLAEVFLSWLKNENSGTSSAAVPTPKATTSNEEVSAPAAASGYDKAKAAANRLKQPEEPLPQEPEDLLGWIQDGAENDQD